MGSIVAYISGLVFGIGLLVSGLTEPENILRFLDLRSENWNSSLAIVMGIAVVVYGLGFRAAKKRRKPWFEATFHLPTENRMTPQLFLGALLFGVGWGLAGFCPGPAVVASAMLRPRALVFLASMIVGMML